MKVSTFTSPKKKVQSVFLHPNSTVKGQCTAAAAAAAAAAVGQALKDHKCVYMIQQLHMRVLAGQT